MSYLSTYFFKIPYLLVRFFYPSTGYVSETGIFPVEMKILSQKMNPLGFERVGKLADIMLKAALRNLNPAHSFNRRLRQFVFYRHLPDNM